MSFKGLAVLVAACGVANADEDEFSSYENSSGTDVSGLDLTVELVDGGTYVDFNFENESSISAVVTAIYFENTSFWSSSLTAGSIVEESANVDFESGATPHSPAQPGMDFGGHWTGTAYAADAESPGPHNGIKASVGDELTIRFQLSGGATFQDIVDGLTGDEPEARIAMHIQGVGAGSESVWGITVPTPAAAFGMVGLLAARRRR